MLSQSLQAEADRILAIVAASIERNTIIDRQVSDYLFARLLARTNRSLGQVGRQAKERIRRHYDELFPVVSPQLPEGFSFLMDVTALYASLEAARRTNAE